MRGQGMTTRWAAGAGPGECSQPLGNIIPDRSGTVVPTDREFRFGSQMAGKRRLVLRQKGSDEIEWYNPQKPDGGWCACQYDRHTGTGTAA